MKGLEVSILPLSSVQEENSKIRIDSGFFTKAALQAESLVEGLPNDPLGDLTATFRKGIFDIKADTYVDPGEGVRFIRITDIKRGMIQKHSTAWIDHSAHAREAKTALKFGDLVLSKTAYPAAAFVNLPECNVSQDTIAVRLSADGKRHYRSGYIAAFLNSAHGVALMARRFQGNVQQHLSLEDGKSIRIPRLDLKFQERVHAIILRIDKQQSRSRRRYRRLRRYVWQPSALPIGPRQNPSPMPPVQRMSSLRVGLTRSTTCPRKSRCGNLSRRCPVNSCRIGWAASVTSGCPTEHRRRCECATMT